MISVAKHGLPRLEAEATCVQNVCARADGNWQQPEGANAKSLPRTLLLCMGPS